MNIARVAGVVIVVAIVVGAVWFVVSRPKPLPGGIYDEAMTAGRDASTFPAADEDYFHDMDGGVTLTPDQVKGRDTWLVWTGGDDRLWDVMSVKSVGVLDFLKTISSYPGLPTNRDNRWTYLGLVNEPCFEKATGPDPNRYGLWLDKRSANCPLDPFENENKYPGVKIGARGKNIDAGSYYGYATGVVGLRLFPNPAFDEAAQKRWDWRRYYTDKSYYNSKDLVRPYRVGMSCAFCHAGPNPLHPPADPEHPTWADLSSTVGAQYFWLDRIFSWQQDRSNYFWQLFHTSRPGTLDTSLISTDNINNPRTMNAIYLLLPRLENAKRWGKETLKGGGLNNRQFNDFTTDAPLAMLFQPPDTVWTPRVLKDGSDSVGALGALNRVYVNIGVDSEDWLTHFTALIGGKTVSPIQVAVARKNSAYFAATENQTYDMALFLVAASSPHHLKDAPGGAKYLTSDTALLTRGKIVFAETCARCHSSKRPAMAPGLDPDGCNGKGYLDCWNKYWAWTKTEDFKSKMRPIVLAANFLDNNYLSAEFRVPVTLLHTNACSPLATNAIGGNIWDNFSSQSYKDLPSVGDITVYNPFTGEPSTYHMPAGGRGYTRPASLVSLWSTAPYLLNNSVGPPSDDFETNPSVDARMRTFQQSIEQMLWPDRREKDAVLGAMVPGKIDRTTEPSYLEVSPGYLPDFLQRIKRLKDGGIRIGPFPAGMPVDLLANTDVDPAARAKHVKTFADLLIHMPVELNTLSHGATDPRARANQAKVAQDLYALSKCPDFVVNRGHYFGTGFLEPGEAGPPPEPALSDQDKRALIEFLKTF